MTMLRTTEEDVLKQCKQLQRDGRHEEALVLVRRALHFHQLPKAKWDAVGRFLRTCFAETKQQTLKIHVLGQCTTSWLTPALTTEAWAHGIAATVTDGEYDAMIQDLASLSDPMDVLVLLPWHQRLLAAGDRTRTERVADELGMLRQAWEMVPRNARLIQVGYDWTQPGSEGFQLGRRFSGNTRLVRAMNDALVDALPDHAYFVDLEQISADLGRRNFYDARNYAWTKHPFSAEGVRELGRHLFAATRAVTTGPKKLLVLDLDNTLWGGVVGELGPLGIELGDSPNGEAFRNFQRLAKQLKERGVVLAVCSKNNLEDAREPFQTNREMVLTLEDFAAFEASWDPKPVAIERIAKKLNLGLDSFVFFDDNRAEREAVRQQLPMVAVVEAPEDPVDYSAALQNGLWFESVNVTTADRQRAEQYCTEQYRQAVQESAGSLADYLSSLQMKAVVSLIDEPDMQRVVQLLSKTNQFNLTTRRHTAEDLRQMLGQEGAIGLCLRLADRFGDYGLISVAVGVPSEGPAERTLRLDTWLMSCRAIGRTVEHFFMNAMLAKASSMGYQRVVGEYIPTVKNAQVANFYPSVHFSEVQSPGDVKKFELALPVDVNCTTHVRSSV